MDNEEETVDTFWGTPARVGSKVMVFCSYLSSWNGEVVAVNNTTNKALVYYADYDKSYRWEDGLDIENVIVY